MENKKEKDAKKRKMEAVFVILACFIILIIMISPSKEEEKIQSIPNRGPDECFYLVDFGVETSKYQDFGNNDYSCLSNPEILKDYTGIRYFVDGTKDKVNKVYLVFTIPNKKVAHSSEERMFLLSAMLSKRALQREITKDEFHSMEKLLFEKDGVIIFDNLKFEVKTELYEKAGGYKKEFIIEL